MTQESTDWDDVDGNGWPRSWGIAPCFGPMGVIHPEPFPHYVGDGCNCEEESE